MSRCGECGFDWQMRHERVLPYAAARVPRYRELTSPDVNLAIDLEMLRARPNEEVWSPLEYLAHMRDVTEFFADRIHRVLTEDRPVLHVQASFAELAELRCYRSEDPAVALTEFEDRARDLQTLLSNLDKRQWHRTGVGSGGDQRTVLALARRFAHEVHHHLFDIEEQVGPIT